MERVRMGQLFPISIVIFALIFGLISLSSYTVPVEAVTDKVKVLIGFQGPPNEALVKSNGGVASHNFHPFINVLAVTIPETALDGISKNPKVLYIEEDAIATSLGHTSSDPEYQNSWGVDHIDADVVASLGNKGNGIKVAVLDSGIDYSHVDLNDNYVAGGFDYVNNDPDPFDDHWHGTHVAGTVAAEKNGVGVVGTGPEISISAVKVLDNTGFGFYSDIIAGIQWSSNNVDIASMSFGGTSGSQALQAAVTQAYTNGLLMVAASGNSGNQGGGGNNILFPAKYDEVIAVGATYPNDNRAVFSSTGSQLEIMAPGDDIISTYPGDRYAYASGTSMATPHVSGSAALVMNSDERCWESLGHTNGNAIWTNTEVRTVLDNTADDLGDPGRDSRYGYGLVDPDEAAQQCTLSLFCDDMTITQLLASGLYNIIDNRDGSLGTIIDGTDGDDLILASDAGNTINARFGNDCILGGALDDVIFGNGDDDQIFGQDGNDDIFAGGGSDIVDGGNGNDIIYGKSQNDILRGGAGDDKIFGNHGDDQLFGQDGNDELRGGGSDDIISGGNGNDIIYGKSQHDILTGGAGDDSIIAGGGNDVLTGDAGDDTLNGNSGIDTCNSDAEDTTPPVKCEL